eukprot:SAG31_NODE_20160_length_582_cov_0.743271_1_plen_131_part_10
MCSRIGDLVGGLELATAAILHLKSAAMSADGTASNRVRRQPVLQAARMQVDVTHTATKLLLANPQLMQRISAPLNSTFSSQLSSNWTHSQQHLRQLPSTASLVLGKDKRGPLRASATVQTLPTLQSVGSIS